ncbi:MAG: Gfo/Idh/MocA family oxidoreductase [Deltaproteobacteria bacterium]|nr:Gfo/Idh/MocA family oxidoreductase [Deltaproteobacteria bacterium]
MRFLVIGLGSMGKRRIRCLKALGQTGIYGFDPRKDRRGEAEQRYGVKTFADIHEAIKAARPDAFLICAPPDAHHIYMKEAVAAKTPFFVEASVVDTGLDEIKRQTVAAGIVAAPSATLYFHPAIKTVSEIVASGRLGKVSNVILHSGQYLPDWHTYERVSDYYVSNPATGGGREIVPFELTWLTKVFGFPGRVCANFRKTISIEGAEAIDDTYNCLLDYGGFLASVTVDVVSRRAVRRLLVNGSEGQLLWDWDVNCVKVYDPAKAAWVEHGYEMKGAEAGYNANIGENMYIDEVAAFIDAVSGKTPFPNTLEDDHKVLKLLYAIEESDRSSAFVRFDEKTGV